MSPRLSALAFLLSASLGFAAEPAKPVSSDPDGDAALDALVTRLEKLVLYHPRPYGVADISRFQAKGGQRLNYKTEQGAQAAWLIPPAAGGAPERLWIVCPGNGTLALEMAPLCRADVFQHDACLLVDYPGYGACAGEPSPDGIRANLKAATLLAARTLHFDADKLPQTVCALGHSLGAAAALLAVQEFNLRVAVLCAPFTSTQEMAQRRFHTQRQLPIQHPFNNREGLSALERAHGHAWILHGVADSAIPVDMSQALAREFPKTVTLKTIPGAGHNDFFGAAAKDLWAAVAEARK